MSLTLSTADAALREFYLPAVREQLNNTNWLLSQIDKNSKDVQGRRAILSLHVSRNSSVGARQSGGLLPGTNSGIGQQGYVEERVGMKRNYGRIQIEGDAIEAMKSDQGSFVRAVQSETAGLTEDIKRDINRQLWGDGSGQIVQLGTTTASTTVVVSTTAATAVQLRQIEIGMRIDIGTATDVDSVASDRRVVSVDFDDPAAATFVISGAAVTTSSSHFVYRAGLVASGGNPSNVELTGIRKIVDDAGTLFNVSPVDAPSWVSFVLGNSGTNSAISENRLARVLHGTQIKSGLMPGSEYVMAASDGVFRAYGDSLVPQKRFQGEFNLKGGFSGLSVQAGAAPIALVWEMDCPENRVFYLNTKHLVQHEMCDWGWMDKDGSTLSRVPNQDAYEATLYKYHELTTDQRNAHGLLEDVTSA